MALLALATAFVATDCLRVVVFSYLWTRERHAWLGWWTLAFVCQTIAQAAIIPVLLGDPSPPLQGVSALAVTGATVLLLQGTWAFLGKQADWRWVAAALFGFVTSAAALSLGAPRPFGSVGPLLFLAIAHLTMAVALFRRRHEMSGLGLTLTLFALVASAVHFADFPFLSQVEWFVPWGVAIAGFNELAMTLGLATLHLDRTAAAHRRADARYTELAETLGVAVFDVGADGRLRDANPGMIQLLGYASLDELRALDLAHQLSFTPDERARLLAELLGRDVLVGFETVWRTKAGKPVPVQLFARLERDEAGAPSAVRGFAVDRAEARQLEETLRRTQKLDAIGRLAGGVAHDFNNLLTIIRASLDLASTSRAPTPELLAEALTATDQAAQLTRRLLTFGGRGPSQAERVDVSAGVRQSAALLSRTLGMRHPLDLSGVQPGLWARLDAGLLDQILLNLVLNARDAMPSGGTVTVSVRAQPKGETAGVELCVTDTGHGMTAEQQARLFEPFFTTKGPERGTGLGLATVHGIITQARGEIAVASEPGRGSRFAVWLPAVPSPAPDVSSQPPAGTRRVLVVDDEPAIRRTVCRMLEAAGHRATEAGSGNEAVARLTAGEPYDVVLTDLRMPDGDGRVVARHASALRPRVRVVLMSGYQEEVGDPLEIGADALVGKPFSREALLEAIAAPAARVTAA